MPADADVQRILWQGSPINVALTVAEERRIQFPAPVSIGVPTSLQALMRIQTVNGTAYLLAHAPFAATRVLAREIDTGQTYLLDLSASAEAGPDTAIRIEHGATQTDVTPQRAATPSDLQRYVTLTRFAAQQLFAPLRLVPTLPGVARQPVRQTTGSRLLDGSIEATPLMAWRAGNLYLTAVKLQNRSNKSVLLDPRQLHGRWLSASFQHARLLPAGHAADSTAVYLISAQPFEQSL